MSPDASRNESRCTGLDGGWTPLYGLAMRQFGSGDMDAENVLAFPGMGPEAT